MSWIFVLLFILAVLKPDLCPFKVIRKSSDHLVKRFKDWIDSVVFCEDENGEKSPLYGEKSPSKADKQSKGKKKVKRK